MNVQEAEVQANITESMVPGAAAPKPDGASKLTSELREVMGSPKVPFQSAQGGSGTVVLCPFPRPLRARGLAAQP